MPLQTNLNVSPYYADYDPLSDYYKVLFKAGYPVQARELTNMQLMLQNQIETFSSRILKEGDNIIPGEFGVANPVSYVRTSSITQGATAAEFVGYTLTGVVSGVKGFVNYATAETDDDDTTFYVNYESSGTTSEYSTFLEGETLESDTPNKYTANVGITSVSKPIKSGPLGQGSLFTIKEGYYFVDGSSVRCTDQTITLDKYGTTPSFSVGLLVEEQFITSVENPALLDNSQGSSNFAAPGADRLKITLTLSKRDLDTTSPNFIQLATIVSGNLQGKPDQTVKWDWLYDIMAKRTYDESGDYIVTEFPIQPYEYWNSNTINGIFDVNPVTGLYPPVPGSGSTVDLTPSEADENYAIEVSPGEAYVQGYNVGIKRPAYVYGKKPRTQSFRANTLTQITEGYNVSVVNVNSAPDFFNISGGVNTLAFDTVTLYRNFTDGFVGEGLDANGKPFNIGNAPPTTYHLICDGDIGGGAVTPTVIYRGTNSAVVTSGSPLVRGSTIGNATVMVSTVVNPEPAGVMSPRYLKPGQRVNDNNGLFGYNSSYDLGIMTSTYFTQLEMVNADDSVNFDSDWEVGDLVYGEQTAAFATVESGSTPTILIVSNISGEFAPGETITQGVKSSQIAKEGEVFGFNFLDKGSGNNVISLANETTLTISAIGSTITLTKDVDYEYLSVTNTLRPLPAGRTKLRNFPYPEGSTINNRINFAVESAPGGVKGYAVIISGKVSNTLTKTKSFYAPLADTNDFSADISIQNNGDSEITPMADNSLFSGLKDSNFLECDNFSGDPADQLEFGDLVTFVDDTGNSISKFVFFVTKPVGYGSLRSKSIIYFTTTLPNNVTGKTVQRVRVKSKGEPQQNLIFELPQNVVASLETDPLATKIAYQVYKEYEVTLSAGATSATITTATAQQAFIDSAAMTSLVVAELPADPTNSSGLEGRSLTVASTLVEDNGRKITYNLSNTVATSVVLKIIAPVYVSNAQAKRKIFRKDEKLILAASDADKYIIPFGRTDVHEVTAITMQVTGVEVDVMNNYRLDNGQRDNVYDISTLILQPGSPKAAGQLTVTYNCFDHSDEGDFFSANSYTDDNGIGYRAIPVYNPITGIPKDTANTPSVFYQLRDCVDFRPAVNTAGNNPSVIASITPGRDSQGSTNFRDTSNGGNAFVPSLPIPGTQFQCDISYYLPKYDSLFLEKTGALTLVEGVPANEPIPPADLATGIRLYNLYLPPYTFTTKQITVKKFNYRRFRMKDIATIDRRVDRLEDLVTLSILEQSALNMQVRDAVTGLDRFKNGIVVDTFRDHSKGAVGQTQYRNSIDPKWTHLRSPHFTDQVELVDTKQTVTEKTGNGYRQSNGIITCNYEDERFLQNPFATRWINLQPFTVFTYDGNLEITPQIDTFQDITQLPDLVIEDNTLFDAMVNLTGTMADSGIGTVWGEWETTGTSQTSQVNTITNTENNRSAVQNAMNSLQIQGVDVGFVDMNQGGWDMLNRSGGVLAPPLRVTNTTTATNQARQQTKTTINVSTGSVQETSYGERVVDVQLARTCRTIPIQIQAYRLKPNTRYYLFFDGIDCSAWMSIDNMTSDWPDGVSRYSGTPNSNPKGFGYSLMSDGTGTITGVFLVPNGRPPVADTTFNGSLEAVQYKTTGPTRQFNTGTRTIRFTSSATNVQDLSQVEGFAEADFVSSGVLLDKQETIVATRIPAFGFSTSTVASQTRVQESQNTSANYFDPVAQTFMIDENSPEGLFTTELDIFFRTKDDTQGVEAYLVSTDGQVPTEEILPHSQVQKRTDSNLRVIASLGVNNSTVFDAGVSITGSLSGATGVVKSSVLFNSASANATTNVTNSVYNVLLSNYVGEFIQGEPIVPTVTPASTATFTVATNEYNVKAANLKTLGENYTTATVTFSAPELPGGVTATATALVNDGQVYDISITNFGSGYTQVPSVTIGGDGSGATAVVAVEDGAKAVEMGVCTSEDGTAATTFKFHAPVYLLGDTNYAFVVKAPTSLDYTIWTSKLGENLLNTETRVVEQPSMGSLFMSQNGGLWTEDQTQDVKFVLRRAKFDTQTTAAVELENAPLGPRKMMKDPIETNSDGVDTGSTIFGDNPQVVRVFANWHGLLTGDLVAISGVSVGATNVGITDADINTLHTVIDANIDYFTINLGKSATTSTRMGGEDGYCTMNRPYECINIYTGAQVFGTSTFISTNRATEYATLNGYNQPYQYRLDDPVNIKLFETYYYPGPKQVASYLNEAKYSGSLYLQGRRSLETTVSMSTLSDKVSPVLDLQRTNATVVRNLIDLPAADDAAQGVQTATLTLGANATGVTGLAKDLELTFANADALQKNIRMSDFNLHTRKLKLTGRYASQLSDASVFENTQLKALGVLGVTTTAGALFVPETSNNGSTFSKWISKLFIFENACDGIEVKLAGVLYDRHDIRVYFRPRNIGFDGDLANVSWIPFNGTGDPDNVDNIKPRSSKVVDPRTLLEDAWQDLTYSAQDLATFDGVAVKIVMTQKNPALAPLIDDIRIVCSE